MSTTIDSRQWKSASGFADRLGGNSVTQAELLRYGWAAMFLIGTVGAGFLVFLFIRDRLAPWVRADSVLRAQADSTISDGVLLLLGAVAGVAAAWAASNGYQIVALVGIVLLGFFYNVLILNMLRGRRSVTRAMRLTVDKLETARAKAKA